MVIQAPQKIGVSVKEAAQLTGMSEDMIREGIYTGLIPANQLVPRGKWIIPYQWLKDWINGAKAEPRGW